MEESKRCYGCMEKKPESARICPHCGYDEQSSYDPSFMPPGTQLNGHYIAGRLLGHNSEGATYIGYNEAIGCRVLIREYMPSGLCVRVRGKATISVNPQQVVTYKALMAEFTELNKSLAQMRTLAHINPTQDLFAENNTTYAVYEYLEGVKLVEYLKDNAGELTWQQVSELFPTFFTTLSLMHNSGIIHRAISPDTIYVTEKGELRLSGFSIAPVRTVHSELPCEMFHGYAAPEQYNPNARQGTWTDVYGISAVLYRILTGCKPTDAPSRLQNDTLCAPHEMNPGIPRNVSRVIMRGLSLFPDDRIQTVTELVTALFEEVEEPAPKVIPVEPSRRTQRERQQEYENYRRQSFDEDDYDTPHDTVIDRIKVPIIIGVLLTCVLLVMAIVVLNFLDMGPFSANPADSGTGESMTLVFSDTQNNVVTESVSEAEISTTAGGDSQMPSLIGKNYESKKQQLEADGWLYLEPSYEYSDEYKAGLIIGQELAAGSPFTSGAVVKVVVSKGPSSIELPEFKGKRLTEYEAELEALGLTNYNTEAVVNYMFENGEVIELSRNAGAKFDLTGDETLKIYYASNPETTPAPDPTDPPPTEAPTEAPPTEAPTEAPATEAPVPETAAPPEEPPTEAPQPVEEQPAPEQPEENAQTPEAPAEE